MEEVWRVGVKCVLRLGVRKRRGWLHYFPFEHYNTIHYCLLNNATTPPKALQTGRKQSKLSRTDQVQPCKGVRGCTGTTRGIVLQKGPTPILFTVHKTRIFGVFSLDCQVSHHILCSSPYQRVPLPKAPKTGKNVKNRKIAWQSREIGPKNGEKQRFLCLKSVPGGVECLGGVVGRSCKILRGVPEPYGLNMAFLERFLAFWEVPPGMGENIKYGAKWCGTWQSREIRPKNGEKQRFLCLKSVPGGVERSWRGRVAHGRIADARVRNRVDWKTFFVVFRRLPSHNGLFRPFWGLLACFPPKQ